jgi:hypothetical protein
MIDLINGSPEVIESNDAAVWELWDSVVSELDSKE